VTCGGESCHIRCWWVWKHGIIRLSQSDLRSFISNCDPVKDKDCFVLVSIHTLMHAYMHPGSSLAHQTSSCTGLSVLVSWESKGPCYVLSSLPDEVVGGGSGSHAWGLNRSKLGKHYIQETNSRAPSHSGLKTRGSWHLQMSLGK
jgi:hypothetical protein